jgi:23S rRNA (adenine2030-N6)-methyltransferase
MLSYQHAFHAGNHADVLKHVILLEVLRYVRHKQTAVFYIDTHAGAGWYALLGAQAQKNREFKSGIGRLWNQSEIPAELQEYIKFVQELNPDGALRYYPGSPYFADKLLRDHDRLRFFELHPTESRILTENFDRIQAHAITNGQKRDTRGKRVVIEKKDGFSALKGQLPPLSRRAVIFMDPPYENKQDYRYAIDALSDAMNRFASGTYIVWYPVLQRPEARRFSEQLKRLPKSEWLDVVLAVSKPLTGDPGLYGSGLFIINPPWKLKPYLEQLMPQLVSLLGQGSGAGYTLLSGTGKPAAKGQGSD